MLSGQTPPDGLSWELRVAGVIATGLLSALWLRWINRTVRPVGARLAAAAPVLLLNAAVPLAFHRYAEPLSVAFSAFFYTWLANFKAVAAVGGRGPLAVRSWSALQYWVLYCLPIVPKSAPAAAPRRGGSQHGPGSEAQMLARWAAKAGATAGVVWALLLPGLPPLGRSCLYVVGLYCMLGVVMDGPAAAVLSPLGLDLAPHFLPPWESRSLAEFWGLRWNQAAGNALRTAVYDPIVDGGLRARGGGGAPRAAGGGAGGEARRLAGMAAAFFASGALHEIIFLYVDGRASPRLAWLWFFAGQVPLIVGERALLAWLARRGVAPPQPLRVALTLGVLLLSAHWLFFLPAEAAGVPARFAESMRRTFTSLAAAPGALAAAAWRGG